MQVDSNTRVGDLVTQNPAASRVLERHAVDFCCGGGQALGDVCLAKGLDVSQLLAEIERETAATSSDETRWDNAPLPKLIDHILGRYHRPLDSELPALAALTERVANRHGSYHPELSDLLQVFLGLKHELEQHMLKEERILFPAIKAGARGNLAGPVAVMELEHETAGRALERIRELTGDFELPDGACNSWRALWGRLEDLERDTHVHIHLENNILFPRALGRAQ